MESRKMLELENWTPIEIERGELVALHVTGDSRSIKKAIFVGKKPWSSRGRRNGEVVDGRLVATGDFKDKNMEYLLLHLLSRSIMLNPDSEVAEYSGEALLVLRGDGVIEGQESVSCRNCGVHSSPAVRARRDFRPDATFGWFVQIKTFTPQLFADSACIECWREVHRDLKTVRKETVGAQRTAAQNDLEGWVFGQTSSYIIREAVVSIAKVDHFLQRVSAAIEAITQGR